MRLIGKTMMVMLACSLPAVGLAERKYGMAGCGLGSVVFGANGPQISAATTNGTGGQPFGITSGTSNCVPDQASEAAMRQEQFMIANYASLSKEMAQGKGESLRGLAMTLGCSNDSMKTFNKVAQANHDKVYSAPGAVAGLDTLKDIVNKHPKLNTSCTLAKAH